MSGHSELTKDVDIDIQLLFSNIWKKKWLILLLSVLAGAAIFILMSSISPRYKTSAQLIIEPRESQFTRVQQQNGGINANDFDTAAVLSQVQILLSDEIALNTIKKLDLASQPEFSKNKEPSVFADLLVIIGIKQNPLDISPEERVLKAFKDRLKAYSIDQSRVIEILFWANDRKLAKQITNTIADEYLKLQRKSKLETDINATKFLEPEIAALRAKVTAAEAKVAEFRSSSDILVGNNNALLATQQLSEISTELSRVRGRRTAAEAKVDSVRSTLNIGASLEAIPEVVASPLIQRLRERQVQLRARISELSTTLLPSHPRLKALKSQVSDFDNQIRREARGILRSLESNVVVTRKQEDAMITELSRLKAEASRAGEAEVQLRALEREAISERELLQAYMTKFREAAGRQNSKYVPINARIISGAHLPTESFFPKTIPYTIAGVIVTAILSMVAILTVSLLSGSAFRKVEQTRPEQYSEDSYYPTSSDETVAANALSQKTEAPADHRQNLEITAEPDFNSVEASQTQPMANEQEEINSVSLISDGLLGMGQTRIAVISPSGDAGSQSTWILARSLANAGKTVALMDMTGSGVTTTQMLGDNALPGIRDILSGNAQISDAIYRDQSSTANILPIGVTKPTDIMFTMERLTGLVEALSENFDYTIVDCGYAEAEDISHIADKDTVVLISSIDSQDGLRLESELISQGYGEAICVHPTKQELQSLEQIAA